MDSQQQIDSKKRNLGHMLAVDLQGKLKSKQDFYVYLDKHRKYHPPNLLIFLQYSTTCPTRAPSIRTS